MATLAAYLPADLRELEKQRRWLDVDEAYALACRELGITPWRLWLQNRSMSIVRGRRMVAKKLRNAGYSLPEIGRAMRRHHTTVLWLLRGGRTKAHLGAS